MPPTSAFTQHRARLPNEPVRFPRCKGFPWQTTSHRTNEGKCTERRDDYRARAILLKFNRFQNAKRTESPSSSPCSSFIIFFYCEEFTREGLRVERAHLGPPRCFAVDLKSYYFVKFRALFRRNVSTGTDGVNCSFKSWIAAVTSRKSSHWESCT